MSDRWRQAAPVVDESDHRVLAWVTGAGAGFPWRLPHHWHGLKRADKRPGVWDVARGRHSRAAYHLTQRRADGHGSGLDDGVRASLRTAVPLARFGALFEMVNRAGRVVIMVDVVVIVLFDLSCDICSFVVMLVVAVVIIHGDDTSLLSCVCVCGSADLVARLQALGYQLTSNWDDRPLGYVQGAAVFDNGTLVGVADPRMSVGSAMAY